MLRLGVSNNIGCFQYYELIQKEVCYVLHPYVCAFPLSTPTSLLPSEYDFPFSLIPLVLLSRKCCSCSVTLFLYYFSASYFVGMYLTRIFVVSVFTLLMHTDIKTSPLHILCCLYLLCYLNFDIVVHFSNLY